ncbi:hypothetical protein HK104_005658 [Borealophlyctis nickersoniae]|nr:hypothetical protein HK104_005658 [Borealophlyctis nickersoniae]
MMGVVAPLTRVLIDRGDRHNKQIAGNRPFLVAVRSATYNLPIEPENKEVILAEVAKITHGFVGSDLRGLCHYVVNEMHRQSTPTELAVDDFRAALKYVKPASLSELISKIPERHLNELFGMQDVIERLRSTVIEPFTHFDRYLTFGIDPPRGVLIHGPPGVGKTVLGCALVQETGFNCVYVDGPKIRSKVVGESEANIAKIFAQARDSAPCVLLIDQIDMLVPSRGMDTSSENTGERIVTCFLTEMDGVLSSGRGAALHGRIFIVAVTNRPHVVDAAILRPGRLDEHIFIPPPKVESRLAILRGYLKSMPNDLTEPDLKHLAEQMAGYSGADIENVCREAALIALRKNLSAETIHLADVMSAMNAIRPSLDTLLEKPLI